jgi:hypothetical protein
VTSRSGQLFEAFAPDASVGAVARRVDVVPAQMCRWRHVGAVLGAVGGIVTKFSLTITHS